LTLNLDQTMARKRRAVARPIVQSACGLLALGAFSLTSLDLRAPAGAAAPSSLSHLLLKSNEEPGYTVGGHPSTITTPSGLIEGAAYPKGTVKTIVATLKMAGFIKAVEESTKGSANNEGLSLVMQFGTRAGAQAGAALFLQLAKDGQAGAKPFTVPGVPDAKGVAVTGGAGGSANAYWSTGSCALGSGIYDGTALSAKAVAKPVQAGIRAQARRIGTSCS
jgi:hypothetical protein